MDPLKTGKLIRKKRLGLSMTQEELADRVFVGKATVSAWETGKTYPNMQSQMLLYKVLGINPLELDDRPRYAGSPTEKRGGGFHYEEYRYNRWIH